ncbi:hypothetical protein BD311DRAFT_762981 [Dichomitus squalens]|uniref:Uncharacterized protein n=1 Tax=Dichomitus squalens TaxID=114155 RepID=A0A4Q9MJT7_9APHY|nr:hypothetical protein BD311DRAFT_762981 [Dichomitus squalens]
MRLLDNRTGQFVERDPRETRYAILSHTWDKVEQTYQDILDIQTSYGHKGRLCISSLPVGVARSILHKGRDMGLSLSRFASSASLHRPRIRMQRSARSNAVQEFSSSRLPTVPLSADTSSSHTHPTDRTLSETGFPVTSIWHNPRE